MEHVVQFGINIDDEAIKKAVSANVEKEVIAGIRKKVEKDMGFGDYNFRYGSRFAQEVVETVLDEHLEEIVDSVSTRVAERLCKRKSFADAVLGSVKDEG